MRSLTCCLTASSLFLTHTLQEDIRGVFVVEARDPQQSLGPGRGQQGPPGHDEGPRRSEGNRREDSRRDDNRRQRGDGRRERPPGSGESRDDRRNERDGDRRDRGRDRNRGDNRQPPPGRRGGLRSDSSSRDQLADPVPLQDSVIGGHPRHRRSGSSSSGSAGGPEQHHNSKVVAIPCSEDSAADSKMPWVCGRT